jgi:hypothetical protein
MRHLYRIRSCYLAEHQNRLNKTILSQGDDVATEDIDFIAWTRRSKKATEKTDKTISITTKSGKTKTIYKCKRKSGFGKSVTNNSPGAVIAELGRILNYYGKQITFLNTRKVKLSQYNHDTDECVKVSLSTREKTVCGQKVQRDCYSAFLASNYENEETINRERCFNTFDKFIEHQNICLRNLKLRGDQYPTCMGIN